MPVENPVVAVDVEGADKGVAELVAGAKKAAGEGIRVVLYGRRDVMGDVEGLDVVETSEVVEMGDDIAVVRARGKTDASMVRAVEAVRDHTADAVVSAGNTGAMAAASTLRLRRISGVIRPAIAVSLPSEPDPTVLIDAGANAEVTPQMLMQFLALGAVLSSEEHGVAKPLLDLLSVGEEKSKGTPNVREAHEALLKMQESAGGLLLPSGELAVFKGNVEGRDLMKGRAHVVATDGFTGNVVLKTLEGFTGVIVDKIGGLSRRSDEYKAAIDTLFLGLIELHQEMHPDRFGGAPLLGVDGISIISHGSVSTEGYANAIKLADKMVRRDLVGQLAIAIANIAPHLPEVKSKPQGVTIKSDQTVY